MLQSLAITSGTGRTHLLVALGIAAVDAGHKVRYFTAAELNETLYRALADNSVGRVIENPLRKDLVLVDELGFAPLRLGSEASFAALCGTARVPASSGRPSGIGSPAVATGPRTGGQLRTREPIVGLDNR